MSTDPGYRLFLNTDRTILVRIWHTGRLEVAHRHEPDAIWGPPIELVEVREL